MELKTTAAKVNWVLLGLTMLIPGLLKLFVMGPSAVTGMLSGLLIVAEIASGAAILAKWNVKHFVWLPIIILIVAAFTANWGNWASMLLHIALASSYWMLGEKA